MDEDRSTRPAEGIGGNIKEDFSRIAREAQAQIKKDIASEAEDIYDQLRDAPSHLAATLQRTIKQQPFTAVAIAVAVGWLLGRTHRPI